MQIQTSGMKCDLQRFHVHFFGTFKWDERIAYTASFISERMLGVHDSFLKRCLFPQIFQIFSLYISRLLALGHGHQQELHNAWGGHKFLALRIHVCRVWCFFFSPWTDHRGDFTHVGCLFCQRWKSCLLQSEAIWFEQWKNTMVV